MFIDFEIQQQFLLRDLNPIRNRFVAKINDGKLKELLARAHELSDAEGEELKTEASEFVQVFADLSKQVQKILEVIEVRHGMMTSDFDNQMVGNKLKDLLTDAETLEDLTLEALELDPDPPIELQASLDRLQEIISQGPDSIYNLLEEPKEIHSFIARLDELYKD